MPGEAEAARRVSDELSGAFIALARSGSPEHAGLTRWPQHRIPARETMIFAAETRAERDPRGVERELFAKVPFIQRWLVCLNRSRSVYKWISALWVMPQTGLAASALK